ncbi:unnamed protein product [Paramecium primaurelia]|uniref:Transmembrane protein n=1 Tax=Paramecium primaurelia TaxID=5886 RepID=A0A8S1NN00_PARPR|nr:unnamed protein product [Paramecium primaurelia]
MFSRKFILRNWSQIEVKISFANLINGKKIELKQCSDAYFLLIGFLIIKTFFFFSKFLILSILNTVMIFTHQCCCNLQYSYQKQYREILTCKQTLKQSIRKNLIQYYNQNNLFPHYYYFFQILNLLHLKFFTKRTFYQYLEFNLDLRSEIFKAYMMFQLRLEEEKILLSIKLLNQKFDFANQFNYTQFEILEELHFDISKTFIEFQENQKQKRRVQIRINQFHYLLQKLFQLLLKKFKKQQYYKLFILQRQVKCIAIKL